MAIQVGDHLPQSTFRVMTAEGPAVKTTDDLFKGRRAVLVAVPGAFTPTCDRNHMPGYVTHADAIKAKGIDAILVTAVNDVFVLEAWGKSREAAGKIELISDGNAEFAKAIGLAFDGAGFGLGTRSQRYSMLVEDGVVRALHVEDGRGKVDASSAETMLASLDSVPAG